LGFTAGTSKRKEGKREGGVRKRKRSKEKRRERKGKEKKRKRGKEKKYNNHRICRLRLYFIRKMTQFPKK
jgi:hypothetical protein